ncbi:nucleotide disphospho-sugar-binding domain-containing protein [Nocardiopsis sp. NPDC007018]|uniref:glycosyltransferase n=1 Tax=Nocardiopsis sp. NPDC007018 TaxID=3155721 RepID=UPI0033FF78F7
MPLVQELRRRGKDVLLLGPSGLEHLARTLGVGFRPYTSGISYDWSERGKSDGHALGPQALGRSWFSERVRAEFLEVERAASSFGPSVLLADSFVVGAGLAAECQNIAWASYVHYLFDEGAEVDAMHRIWWEGPEPEHEAYRRWWDDLRGCVSMGPETRPPQDSPWLRMSPHLTFLLGHPLLRRGPSEPPRYVARTSFPPWDETETDVAPPARPIRTPRRPRVLVANSSAWQNDLALVRATLSALADQDVDVVATVAAKHDLGADVPSNAVISGYTSHTLLLPHVDVVVSTAGYGLVSKALWWGRPLVLAPRGRDQHYVAEAVSRAGCGVQVPWPPDPCDLGGAVEAAIGSTRARERAGRLSGPVPGYASPRRAADMLLDLAGRS